MTEQLVNKSRHNKQQLMATSRKEWTDINGMDFLLQQNKGFSFIWQVFSKQPKGKRF